MAKLNLDYVVEKAHNLISPIESELIEYITNAINVDFNSIVSKYNNWDVFYHLTPLRADLINWYPFKEGSDILNIGADFGTIAMNMCEKAKSVTVLEVCPQKAKCIYKNCFKFDNIEVIATSIDFFKATKKFDYIIFEDAECTSPMEDIVTFLKTILTQNGKVLFLLEDKFGSKQMKTYAKEELMDILNSRGFSYSHCFYPFDESSLAQKKYKNIPNPSNTYKNFKDFLYNNYVLETSLCDESIAQIAFNDYQKKLHNEYIKYLQKKIIKYSEKMAIDKEVKSNQNSLEKKCPETKNISKKCLKSNVFENAKKIFTNISNKSFLAKLDRAKLNIQIKKAYRNLIICSAVTAVQYEYEKKFRFNNPVMFSIVCPLYNTPDVYLTDLITSVLKQSYSNLELCFADGSDKENNIMSIIKSFDDARIKYNKLEANLGISENTNSAIKMASGDYICFIDHDDILSTSALFEYMKAINNTHADFLYCDEDKFKVKTGAYFEPNFKPDFCIDNLRANNYICHFSVCKKELLYEVGFLNPEFDGSQDHDLVLRISEKAKRIYHIPRILYHWRVCETSVAKDPNAKEYTVTAGKNAVLAHLNRVGLEAKIKSSVAHPNIYEIQYKVSIKPKVTIAIRTAGDKQLLVYCIDSILENAEYENYNILIVPYKNMDLKDICNKSDKIEVLTNDYSECYGEYIIFLKENVQIKTKNFIFEMLQFGQRYDVACVTAKGYDEQNSLIYPSFSKGMSRNTDAGFIYTAMDKSEYGYFGRMCYTFNVSSIKKNCFMIKREIFQSLDSNIPDFAEQIIEKGLICYNPKCEYMIMKNNDKLKDGLKI